MNTVWKIFLSMSCSGGLLILALLLGKRCLGNAISRQWRYYIWFIVLLRLLLPFGPEVSLLGSTYRAMDQAITQAPSPPPQSAPDISEDELTPAVGAERADENRQAETWTAVQPLRDVGELLLHQIWLVWLVAALGLLIRKITIYQGFIRYVKAGMTPVSDIEKLDQLSAAAERAGVGKPVELCVNPLISSPLLIGAFRPCVVLPRADIPEKEFWYIALHELTHYKRRDMFYKWLVQVTVCLHWFNPLVYLMSREITRACEFSCDEAVLTKMGCDNAQDYGKTLLNAMAAVGKYKESVGAVTLSENKQLLKERLGAIMSFKKKSKAIRLLTGMLTLCVIFSAAFVGVYSTAAAADVPNTVNAVKKIMGLFGIAKYDNFVYPKETTASIENNSSEIERYYKAGSLPLFEITFPRLDENTQKMWLERLYADGDFAFFSVAVRGIDTDSSLFADFAEKAYTDEEMAFFSIFTDRMGKARLELWLDRALEDENWAFQSILFDRLNRRGEFDELKEKQEKEWAEAQMAEYRAVGVTMDGKDYYYKGQLVNVFLDIRPNKAFYALNMNPKGTVNIRIIRSNDNVITGVAYMTEAEVKELLEEDGSDDEMEVIPVKFKDAGLFHKKRFGGCGLLVCT
ncbi:MAG: hypothetical protein HFF30_05795 [Flavonifractor sp.]|nr:hypothetical protein [Flavonifractor sp.]